MADQPNFMLTPLRGVVFNDFTVQTPFVQCMSSDLSQSIARYGFDPLKTTLGRFQYGLGVDAAPNAMSYGGMRDVASLLQFPSTTASPAMPRRRRRCRKRKATSTVRRTTRRRGRKSTVGQGGARRRRKARKTRRRRMTKSTTRRRRRRTTKRTTAGRRRKAQKRRTTQTKQCTTRRTTRRKRRTLPSAAVNSDYMF